MQETFRDLKSAREKNRCHITILQTRVDAASSALSLFTSLGETCDDHHP